MIKAWLVTSLIFLVIPVQGVADCRKELMVDSIELDGEPIERMINNRLDYGVDLVMNDELITSLKFEGIYRCLDGRYIKFVDSDTLVKIDCDGNRCKRSF